MFVCSLMVKAGWLILRNCFQYGFLIINGIFGKCMDCCHWLDYGPLIDCRSKNKPKYFSKYIIFACCNLKLWSFEIVKLWNGTSRNLDLWILSIWNLEVSKLRNCETSECWRFKLRDFVVLKLGSTYYSNILSNNLLIT